MTAGGNTPRPGVRAAAVAAVALAIGIASWLSIATPYPSLLSPYSLTVVIPYLWAGGPFPALVIHAAVFLIAPGARLASGRVRRPGASAGLFALLATLSLLFASWGVRPGLRHYGTAHTAWVVLADLLLIATLASLLIRARRRPTFAGVLAFHGLLWAWLAWIGLPWLHQLF